MREENLKTLEQLGKTCYCAGILPIFLGVLIVFIDAVNRDYGHLLVGLLVFIMGYSFVKISVKISRIIAAEKD